MRDQAKKERETSLIFLLYVFSIVLGIFSGLGAVIFRHLITFVHNVVFPGKISIQYSATVHTPESFLGFGVIFAPVAGAWIVAFLVKNDTLDAKGAGVPVVMDAIYYGRGFIRPITGDRKRKIKQDRFGDDISQRTSAPTMSRSYRRFLPERLSHIWRHFIAPLCLLFHPACG